MPSGDDKQMRRLLSPITLSLTLALVSGLLYVGYSQHFEFVGFPLDDAWIHQTYARNLGRYHQFAYNLGEPSVGSTSPLWTLLLTAPHALGLDPRPYTYLLGGVFLALTGWIIYRLTRLLFPHDKLAPWLTCAFCLLEWHMAWAAFSGMETILFVFLSLLALERYLADERPLVIGLLSGLLTLTRPEGLILTLLLLIDTFSRRFTGAPPQTWRQLGQYVVALLLGFLVPVAPYLALNVTVTGNLFPNTFYAKQAEYEELVASLPIWVRWTRVAAAPLVGAQILLIPGFIYAAYKGFALAERRILLPLAWWFALVSLYAVRLPVTYQHGRYLIPSIPVLLLLGVWGTRNLPGLHRIVRQVLFISIPLLLLIFWVRGAQQYATDVRIIDSELTAAGRWIRANTTPDAIIGAHDIGAVGYFSERFLVDTAGLITPEVIPFIRDEDRVLDFLEQKDVDFVVIFPSWYPSIAQSPRLRVVYRSSSPWVVEAGGDNVVIYETAWGRQR
jgi:arabinofuranosyltransferase